MYLPVTLLLIFVEIKGRRTSGCLRVFTTVALFYQLWDQKYGFDTLFLALTVNTYWTNSCIYVDKTWACSTQLLLAFVSLYRRFTTWCLIIKHESHNTLYVPRCGIFSEKIFRYIPFFPRMTYFNMLIKCCKTNSYQSWIYFSWLPGKTVIDMCFRYWCNILLCIERVCSHL